MKEAKWAQTHQPKMKKFPDNEAEKKNLMKYPWDANITDKIAHFSISHLLLKIAPLNLKKNTHFKKNPQPIDEKSQCEEICEAPKSKEAQYVQTPKPQMKKLLCQ